MEAVEVAWVAVPEEVEECPADHLAALTEAAAEDAVKEEAAKHSEASNLDVFSVFVFRFSQNQIKAMSSSSYSLIQSMHRKSCFRSLLMFH